MFVRPQKSWDVAELARRMDVPSSSLQRELQDLTDTGILKGNWQGRMAYFQPNTEFRLSSDPRDLLL
jgi:predicted transcriptional regulator